MCFTDITFLFYFLPISVGVYYLLKKHVTLRNMWLFLCSIFFYALCNVGYAVLLILMIVVNYLLGLAVARKNNSKVLCYRSVASHVKLAVARKNNSKALCVFAILLNTAVLFTGKFLQFTINGISEIFEYGISVNLNIAVPIGISLFFMRSVSYLLDIADKNCENHKDFLSTALFFSFFPTMMLGPLFRFEIFREKLVSNEHSVRRASFGVCRFVIGLAKKVLLANTLILIYTRIFNLSTIGEAVYAVPVTLAWLGVITGILAVCTDLSAYYDMAIGLCMLFGFKCQEEMDYPLSKVTITSFFQSLSHSVYGWFQKYIFAARYQKSKKNKDAAIMALLLTWLVIGLFVGPGWNRMLWSIGIFFLLVVEDFFELERLEAKQWLHRILTLVSLCLLFAVFETQDLYQAGIYLSNMFGTTFNGFFSEIAMMYLREFWIYYLLSFLFAFPVARIINEKLYNGSMGKAGKILTLLYVPVLLLLFVLSVSVITVGNTPDFIFANF